MSTAEASGPAGDTAIDVVPVELGARRYPIRVGPGLLAETGTHAAPLMANRRCTVVTDETVGAHYLDIVARSLRAADVAVETMTVPPGEQTKELAKLEALLEALIDRGVERETTLIALGGGVVGDLVGFAASIVLRGIPFIQIPTTLLAQVDSAVGGKTGVNSRHGKNLIGSFYQPRLVLADTDTLDTLPDRQVRAGYAEVVKYGLIDDPAFFAWLESNGAALLAGESAARRHAIVTCCRAKARIVAADERESGQRALLNLGHTFGHALEAETGFGDALLHGEAVALGTVMAFRLSARLGHCTAGDAERVRAHLRAMGLLTDGAGLPAAARRPDRLLAHMKHDKKARSGRLAFVLARGIGQAFLTSDVSPNAVRASLVEVLASCAPHNP